jgi:hypothetical protein
VILGRFFTLGLPPNLQEGPFFGLGGLNMDAHAKVTVKRHGTARSKFGPEKSRKTALIAQS